MRTRTQVVQTIHFPVSARSFVAPLVDALNGAGIHTELWFQPAWDIPAELNECGVPSRHVAVDISAKPHSVLQRVGNLRRQIQEVRPSVLHAHQMRASVIPLLSAWMERVPIRIYHNHGLPYLGYSGLQRFLLKSIDRFNMSLATHVIFVSHSNMMAAVEHRMVSRAKGRVFAHGSAVGINFTQYSQEKFSVSARVRAREEFGVSHSEFVFGYVGRPVARKGFHRLLAAWREGRLYERNASLLIAGCTARECAAVAGDQVSGVNAIGYSSDLLPFYAACDAVVLPSDHEGFPYALLEASAAGNALIGSDIPGIQCAIEHGVTGLLVKKGDVADLTKAMSYLLQNREVTRIFGQNARKRSQTRFTRETILADFLNFYRNDLRLQPNHNPPGDKAR